MHAKLLASFFQSDRVVLAMCSFGIAVLVIGVLAIRNDVPQAHGLDKIAVLCTLCYAVPLGMFGALHLFGVRFVLDLVPKYMPDRLFWAYFVGCALLATSLSMATRIAVRWSGVLIGILMFMFVVMLYILRGVMIEPRNRIIWTIVFRETSFGAAGWILAGNAMRGWRAEGKGTLVIVGRTLMSFTAIMFGIEHFLHPLGLPGVPLQREMPVWVPARVLIDYITGAGLVVTGACLLLNRKARIAATLLGGWLLLMILVIYVPVMIGLLASLNLPMQVEGLNYFADTLFFTGVILAAASASPHSA
jgi:uncharacterized membrane protein